MQIILSLFVLFYGVSALNNPHQNPMAYLEQVKSKIISKSIEPGVVERTLKKIIKG